MQRQFDSGWGHSVMGDLIKTMLPYVGSFIGGAILTPFFGGFVKEFFEERNRKKKHKLNVAKHVLNLCNEASGSSFQISPRDQEHINSVLTNVKGIDKNIAVIVNRMVTLWRLISGFASKNLTNDDINFVTEMRREADLKREKIIVWANKIRY